MTLDRTLSIAPMMDWTDRHDRYFLRLISPHSLLYTEMVTTGALLHGDAQRFLRFDPAEQPVAIQLGGSCPSDLATCAKMAEEAGFCEINLNVGCPSDRVQSGRFGACLMAEPQLVADCVAAMQHAVRIPVTVKTRIGIDDSDDYPFFKNFVSVVHQAGCQVFIVHARKAWLKGLSPKENREVPPLRYDLVAQLKQEMPHLSLSLNGGIKTLAQVQQHLKTFDGVMLGREAYQNPYFLAELEQSIFNNKNVLSRQAVIMAMLPYVKRQIAQGVPLKSITRHLLGLFKGEGGAKQWRRYLSQHVHLAGVNESLLLAALQSLLS